MLLKNLHSKILRTYTSKLFSTSKTKAAVFAGQGTQKVGMAKKFSEIDWSRKFLEDCDNALGFSKITKIMFEGPDQTLDATENTQPAIFINSYLLYEEAKREGTIIEDEIRYWFGHSLGEYNALCAVGVLEPVEAVKLLRLRGELIKKACLGREKAGMLLGICNETILKNAVEKAKPLFPDLVCEISALNSPKQTLISGDNAILTQISKDLRTQRVVTVKPKVTAAFHSPLLKSIKAEFEEALNKVKISAPKGDVLRNLDNKIYRNEKDIIRGLVDQLDNPVQFRLTMEKCKAEGINDFLDIGSSAILQTMIKQNLPEANIIVFNSM